MPLQNLIQYLELPLITQGVIVTLARGTIQRCTQKNLGDICACCDMNRKGLGRNSQVPHKKGQTKVREDFELGQYILRHEFSGVDNNPAGGKRKGNCSHVAGECTYVFKLGNEIVVWVCKMTEGNLLDAFAFETLCWPTMKE